MTNDDDADDVFLINHCRLLLCMFENCSTRQQSSTIDCLHKNDDKTKQQQKW